jgi:hypothetical protein|tara:strand:- start:99 stop:578 length:480 start_codon:yes stop_codon:yes gene_type:complete
MVFGLLYDPLPDAEFVLERFREIKKNLHPTFKKKRYLVEGDMEKYLKSKNIIWKNTIKKKEKITMKNEGKFSWQYKKDKQFNFHIMPLFGVAFRCYSFDIPGFEAVMQFRKEDSKLELITREHQPAGALGPKQSSTSATRLARYLVKNYKFRNASNMHF